MNFFKRIIKRTICDHEWQFHGWSYIKCKKCEQVKIDEAKNAELQQKFWEDRIIEGDPIFGRDAINKLNNKFLRKRGLPPRFL